MLKSDIQKLLDLLNSGDRRTLSKVITLVESKHPEQKKLARQIIMALPQQKKVTPRIAISGAPGVGKSSFLETFGLYLIEKGIKPAILTIDPSSHLSGGSILGDRTRMEQLSKHPDAYIRQSPSANFLGGVSRRTRETIMICEAAGFDITLIETVGVGQSEYLAADLSDIFTLLIQPGSGDDLQGVKKGVMEMADVLVVTKDDGELVKSARTSKRHLKSAINILRPKAHGLGREVLSVSALENIGFETYWNVISGLHNELARSGQLIERRRAQQASWLKDVIDELWLDHLHNDSQTANEIIKAIEAIRKGETHVYEAAMQIIGKRS